MPLSLQLGFPHVPKSITNPNVNIKDALDIGEPMAFLTFIKIINVSYSPDSLQSYYNSYIKSWNSKQNNKIEDEQALIVDRYKNFLKELTLNYTTEDERKFLSLIDFDDPHDMDIAVSFYGKKLKELALFYNNKREDLKFNITRNKLRGTNFGIGKNIKELTLSYLKNFDGGNLEYDLAELTPKLEIEIEELYNTFALYYNQEPDSTYDHKDLDFGYDIFLKDNQEIKDEVFSNLSEDLLELKEIDDLLDNKRKLTPKYLLTDFYYLSTGDTVYDFLSGKLFESDNNVLNFSNRDYPTTASEDNIEFLKSDKQIGFFKPSKISIILVDGDNDSYSFNFDKLEPNSLYYFPDPSIISNRENIVSFIVDNSKIKRNFTSGNAINQPISNQYDTKYYGYVSKIEPSEQKYLDSIFDLGFVSDSKSDIYGNLLGLFKNDHRLRQTIELTPVSTTYNLVLNGYQFFDDLYGEGLSFDYYVEDDSTFEETIRSGLSSNTNGFVDFIPDLELNFGRFSPYNELIPPTESNLVKQYKIIEGAFFSNYQDIPYSESSSSDLSSFEFDNGPFYYTTLIEGGIHDSTQRALLDASHPTLSANFVNYLRDDTLNIIDGGRFSDYFDSNIELSTSDYSFDSSNTVNTTSYELSSISYVDDYKYNGKLLLRNSITRQTLPIFEHLTYLDTKYSEDVYNELVANIIDFDIIRDVLFIETKSYLVIEKIAMSGKLFVDPKIPSIVISKVGNSYEKISNRYKIKNNVYYTRLKTLSNTISSNNFIIYPEIYEFDTINFKNSKIYPKSVDLVYDSSEFFNISGSDVRYISSDTPKLTYSSTPNLFTLAFLMKDQNRMPRLHNMTFGINNTVNFICHNILNSNVDNYSNILDSLDNVTVFLSSTPIYFDQEYAII